MKAKAWLIPIAIVNMGCRKPYDPPAIASAGSYLVVQGLINPGADSTIITLSKTVPLNSTVTANPLNGATVAVLSDQDNVYPLTETGPGIYTSAGLNLDYSHQYRLDVKTSDGKHYQSDPEPVLVTPPIDSVGFNIVNVPDTGVQVYVNTHDPANRIKYYRWDYTENWEFNSRWVSNYISNGSQLVERTPDQYVSTCYSSDVSSDIELGSSAKLSQASIYQSPLIFIPSTSEKVETRYRVLVRQYGLTSDAYSFWQNLKNNTENLGSIFDAEPSEVPGNIHRISNPSEPVAGYVSVSTVTTKVELISSYQLPAWVPNYPYVCSLDTPTRVGSYNWKNLVYYPELYLAVDGMGNVQSPSSFTWTTRPCADCSIRGSLIPPSFWR